MTATKGQGGAMWGWVSAGAGAALVIVGGALFALYMSGALRWQSATTDPAATSEATKSAGTTSPGTTAPGGRILWAMVHEYRVQAKYADCRFWAAVHRAKVCRDGDNQLPKHGAAHSHQGGGPYCRGTAVFRLGCRVWPQLVEGPIGRSRHYQGRPERISQCEQSGMRVHRRKLAKNPRNLPSKSLTMRDATA